jgi:hypothetical protein
LNLLRSGIGEGRLGRQEIDDAADSFAISTGRDLSRLLSADEEFIRRGDALFRGLQRIIRNENLRDYVLSPLVGERGDRISLCLGR